MELTAANVDNLMIDSLFPPDSKDFSNARCVVGIVNKYGFDPVRLVKNQQSIKLLLNQLPPMFFSVPGNQVHDVGNLGGSFLNMVQTKTGRQWGSQKTAESLMCLGMAVCMVRLVLPRENWDIFLGGVPNLLINTEFPFPNDLPGLKMWMTTEEAFGGHV